jgi:hypothetical protein
MSSRDQAHPTRSSRSALKSRGVRPGRRAGAGARRAAARAGKVGRELSQEGRVLLLTPLAPGIPACSPRFATIEVVWCETNEGGDLFVMHAHREGTTIESDCGIAETHAEC